jgi:hypothetical protein
MAFGIQIDTWDQAPLGTCDLLWLLDLPPSRKEFEQIRSRLRPGTPIILQVFESPAIAPFGLISANQKQVSAVVTYELPDASVRHLVDGARLVRAELVGPSVQRAESLPGAAPTSSPRVDPACGLTKPRHLDGVPRYREASH